MQTVWCTKVIVLVLTCKLCTHAEGSKIKHGNHDSHSLREWLRSPGKPRGSHDMMSNTKSYSHGAIVNKFRNGWTIPAMGNIQAPQNKPPAKTISSVVGSKLFKTRFYDSLPIGKKGSFSLNEEEVKGAGTYQVNADSVDVELKMKITPKGGMPQKAPVAAPLPAPVPVPQPAPAPVPAAAPVLPTFCLVPCAVPQTPAGMCAVTCPASSGGSSSPAAPGGPSRQTPNTVQPPVPKANETVAPTKAVPTVAFDDEVLQAHNMYRQRHSAPIMTLNTSMSKSAAEWAKYLSENKKIEHSSQIKRDKNGENIAEWCDSKEENGGHVSMRWYNEVCDPGYNFDNNDMDWGTSHFTQMVWTQSTQLGVGYHDRKNEDGLFCRTTVARYSPAGNEGGVFQKMVKKGSFEKVKDCKSK